MQAKRLNAPNPLPNSEAQLLRLAIALLGLMGPLFSFDQWHNWDGVRFTLKVVGWVLLSGLQLAVWSDLRLLKVLRFVPLVSMLLIAFLSWICLVRGHITTLMALQMVWCGVVGGLFAVLKRRQPGLFFGALDER